MPDIEKTGAIWANDSILKDRLPWFLMILKAETLYTPLQFSCTASTLLLTSEFPMEFEIDGDDERKLE